MLDTEEKVWTLTANDRCDASCGSQAYVNVIGVNGNLMFCAHHYNNLDKSKLDAFAFEIVDERERLVENRLKGSEN